MADPVLLCLSLSFLVLFNGCPAQARQQQQEFGQCQLDRLDALEPSYRVEAEAGVIESWDPNEQQFRCAGVAAVRYTIEPDGLLLPHYHNAPKLIYIVRGRGVEGTLLPGCPETFQEPQQAFQEGRGRRFRQDKHQKIRHFREGDIIALPAGVAHWAYNDGDSPVVAVSLLDTSNNHNQLDQMPRSFYLAGNPEEEHGLQGKQEYEPRRQRQQGRQQHPGEGGERRRQQKGSGNNLFSGFDADFLAETFNVDVQTARRLQGNDDNRGNIVRVGGRLQVVRPPWSYREREGEESQERERGGEWDQSRYGGSGRDENGLEETICTLRLRENIGDRSRADIYTEEAGRINTLNSQNLPILRSLRLSAERGDLYRDAFYVLTENKELEKKTETGKRILYFCT